MSAELYIANGSNGSNGSKKHSLTLDLRRKAQVKLAKGYLMYIYIYIIYIYIYIYIIIILYMFIVYILPDLCISDSAISGVQASSEILVSCGGSPCWP